jgi:hypothetical protein
MTLFSGQNKYCHSFLSQAFQKNQRKEPLIILGFSLLRRKDAQVIIQAIQN